MMIMQPGEFTSLPLSLFTDWHGLLGKLLVAATGSAYGPHAVDICINMDREVNNQVQMPQNYNITHLLAESRSKTFQCTNVMVQNQLEKLSWGKYFECFNQSFNKAYLKAVLTKMTVDFRIFVDHSSVYANNTTLYCCH